MSNSDAPTTQVPTVSDDRDLDEVTGLGSRRWLMDRLDQALRVDRGEEERVGIVLVDLDRFKLVNDTFGHGVGDELLCAVARRLRQVVRAADPLARLGGDEFCIVMHGPNLESLAPLVGRRVISALSEPFRVAGHDFPVHASVGVALHSPGDDRAELLGHADAALYAAKSKGRHRVEVFDREMRAERYRHRRLALRLADAIESDRLGIRDDVLVDLDLGRPVGRTLSPCWDSDGGEVAEDVVDIARLSGQAPDLGRWMVATALARGAEDPTGNRQLLVSLPSGLVIQPTFGEELTRLAHSHAVDPASVVLLVAEADFDERELVSPVIDTLAAEGFGIGIDDFGRGRASLVLFGSDLVDYVRLAPHLTTDLAGDPSKALYLRGLVDIADAVGQHLIAGQARDVEDLRLLRTLGCHLAVVDRTRMDPPTGWQLDPSVDLRGRDADHPSRVGSAAPPVASST